MVELFDQFWAALQQVLPLSPFAGVLADLSGIAPEWLSWLNWFFPISAILTVMTGWLAAIAVYYIYQAVMRWIGVIS